MSLLGENFDYFLKNLAKSRLTYKSVAKILEDPVQKSKFYPQKP